MYHYQALLSSPANVARVRAVKREIERAGGRMHVLPPEGGQGLTVITIELPPGRFPEEFVPDLPFYPA
jgi:hypothetical protein